MNLEDRKRVEHRCRALQRVGSVLVCMALLLATAFPPPPARAIAGVDDAAIATIIAAYLSSCGMTFRGSGMSSNGVKEQLGRVIDGYLQEEQFGKTPLEWLGEFAVDYRQGCISLPGLIANKLADLARWAVSKFGVEAGAESVLSQKSNGYFVPLSDGTAINFGVIDECGNIVCDGTDLRSVLSDGLVFLCGVEAIKTGDHLKLVKDEMVHTFINFYVITSGYCYRGYDGQWFFRGYDSNGTLIVSGVGKSKLLDYMITDIEETKSVFSLKCNNVISIPEPLAEDQAVVIDAGVSGLTLDDALQAILDAIAAGQLDTTKEITKPGEAVEPGEEVEPVAEEFPDVAELGLPALGAALTSRFPFSIPWDVARAIKLLAAPAKAPYFEVDFMEPIAYRFGGFSGSTKIVLDFSEYEIIGQLTRWTSTIGFCLLLASGTKKLTWTA